MSSQLRLQQQHLRLQKKLYEKKNQLPPSKPILPSENFVITPSSPICIMKIGVDTDMIFDKKSDLIKYIVINSDCYANKISGRHAINIPIPAELKGLKRQHIEYISTIDIGTICAIKTIHLVGEKFTKKDIDPEAVSFILFERVNEYDNFDIRILDNLNYNDSIIKMSELLDIVFSNINRFWIVIKKEDVLHLLYYYNLDTTQKYLCDYEYDDKIINSLNNIDLIKYTFICTMYSIYDITPSMIYILVCDINKTVFILQYTVEMYEFNTEEIDSVFKPLIELYSIDTRLTEAGKYNSFCANYNISIFSIVLELGNGEKTFYTGMIELTKPDGNNKTQIKLEFTKNDTFPKQINDYDAQLMIYTIMKQTEASVKLEEFELKQSKLKEKQEKEMKIEKELKETKAMMVINELLKEEEKEANQKSKKQKQERKRTEKERLEKERLEKERLEKERLEKERLEQEHLILKKKYNEMKATQRLQKQKILIEKQKEKQKDKKEKQKEKNLLKNKTKLEEKTIVKQVEPIEPVKQVETVKQVEPIELVKPVEHIDYEYIDIVEQEDEPMVTQQLYNLNELNITHYSTNNLFLHFMSMINPNLIIDLQRAKNYQHYSDLLYLNQDFVMAAMDMILIIHPEIQSIKHIMDRRQEKGFPITAIYGSILPILYSILLNEIGYIYNAFGTSKPLDKLKDYDTLSLKLLTDDYQYMNRFDDDFIKEQSFIIGYQNYHSSNEAIDVVIDKPITRTKIQCSSIHYLINQCWDLNYTSAILFYEDEKSPRVMRHPDFTDFLFGKQQIQLLFGKNESNLYNKEITDSRLKKAILNWYC